jgi:ribosomal protein S18 acetylase RimI-like enzyme
MSNVIVRQAFAGDRDVALVAPLFDLYRQFYNQPSDLSIARNFIRDRLARGESVIFIAQLGHANAHTKSVAGFIQLYPSFSSVAAHAIWILNDLYVSSDARRSGVARALMEAARQHALSTGARRLVLETYPANRAARSLYESLGYVSENPSGMSYALELP